LADVIRASVERLGWTKYRLAQESGVAQAVVGRFINGERDLKLETADKLCRVLGLRLVGSPKRAKTK
jgi:plasmid maintenance system antidote protein VapI